MGLGLASGRLKAIMHMGCSLFCFRIIEPFDNVSQVLYPFREFLDRIVLKK